MSLASVCVAEEVAAAADGCSAIPRGTLGDCVTEAEKTLVTGGSGSRTRESNECLSATVRCRSLGRRLLLLLLIATGHTCLFLERN